MKEGMAFLPAPPHRPGKPAMRAPTCGIVVGTSVGGGPLAMRAGAAGSLAPPTFRGV